VSVALVLAQAYYDILAAVGVHSGLSSPPRTATPLNSWPEDRETLARAARSQFTIIFQSDEDMVVNSSNGRFIAIRAVESMPGFGDAADAAGSRRAPLCPEHAPGGKRTPPCRDWLIKGAENAWSGGSSAGRFADPAGPNASRKMVLFFLRHKTSLGSRSTHSSL